MTYDIHPCIYKEVVCVTVHVHLGHPLQHQAHLAEVVALPAVCPGDARRLVLVVEAAYQLLRVSFLAIQHVIKGTLRGQRTSYRPRVLVASSKASDFRRVLHLSPTFMSLRAST